MKKLMALAAGLCLLTVLVLVNCDTRTPSGSGGGTTTNVAEVELQVPIEFKAPSGPLEVTVNAIAKSSTGVGIPDVAIEFMLEPGYGTIAYEDSVTNQYGVLEAQYSVDLNTSISEQITARAFNTSFEDTKVLTINLLDQEIKSVSIDAVEPVVYIGTAISVIDTLIVTVVDTNNLGISGLLVNLSSGAGSITNVDTTDNAGQVKTIITFYNDEIPSTANAISTWVFASLGGKTDSTKITVVRQSFTPAQIELTPNPAFILLAEGTQGISNLMTVVTDAGGNGVAGITVNLSVSPTSGVNVTPPDPTDAAGETSTTIKSYAREAGDSVRVVASVTLSSPEGDSLLTDTTYVTFAALEGTISSVNVWAEPPTLTVTSGGSASSSIFARVLDTTNTAIQNLQVSFVSSKGALTPPTLTDSAGVAMVTFYSNGDTGQVVIAATAGDKSDSTIVQVNQSGEATGSLTLTTNLTVIYADGNVTYAIVSATLKNADNEAIVGDTVHFTAYPVESKIASPRITDSTGTAETTFDDLGPGYFTYPDSARIIGKYDPLGLADTLYIMIMPAPTIDRIELSSPASGGMEGNGYDTTSVTAKIYLEDNSYAPPGTAVEFFTTLGTFVPTDTVVQQGGNATVKFVSATSLDTAVITAECQGYVSDPPLLIPFSPGDPVDISLVSIEPSQLMVGGPSGTLTIIVQDTVGHGVSNKQVSWSTTLGTITTLSITDGLGFAVAYLSPQTEAGIAQITAFTPAVAETLNFGIPIISGLPSSIQLSSNVNTIQVQGTGGQEAATLTASVMDPNGNPVPDSILVVFELLSPYPAGAQFDNGGIIDSSLTSSGVARVSLNSGTASGPVKVQATTWEDPPLNTLPITAQKSNITIASGPPYDIDIDYSSDPQIAGENGMGAALMIEVNARVSDVYGNNVSGETAVFFSVDTTMHSLWWGNYAHIEGGSIVIDTTGIAFTNLYYNSEATFKSVNVIAMCVSDTAIADTTISDTSTVILPIYEGDMVLTVTPESHMFIQVPPYDDICVMRAKATLKDGLNNKINNAKVIFNNGLGLFFCADSGYANVTNLPAGWDTLSHLYWRFETFTGPNPIDSINYQLPGFNQQNGEAILYMRAIEVNSTASNPPYPGVFIDPMTLEVIGEIEATLDGSDIGSDPVNVTFRRSA
ncbi:MAG: Ig-like domain-containing protein [candidate division Zixibacteria bacterium]|nr:Ig-like domain-containing protein [Candidatus Tariuqbacter arcticus]